MTEVVVRSLTKTFAGLRAVEAQLRIPSTARVLGDHRELQAMASVSHCRIGRPSQRVLQQD